MAEAITGRVLNPPSIIDYQQGSIVSRILLKKKTGSVTLFAFDEGQELSEQERLACRALCKRIADLACKLG